MRLPKVEGSDRATLELSEAAALGARLAVRRRRREGLDPATIRALVHREAVDRMGASTRKPGRRIAIEVAVRRAIDEALCEAPGPSFGVHECN